MHSDLWSFSLDLYARLGIEQACLELQADGANVCLMLGAAWLGHLGVACTPERLAQLRTLAWPWHDEVIRPLRKLRQDWTNAAKLDRELEVMREQIKTLELEAERQLLTRIENLAQEWAAVGADDMTLWLEGVVPSSARENRGALQRLHAASTSA
ncbi:TIGR02444 family protein [Pseudomonas abieticivorans]|uniref:TIGR02444 family protein n=1 Tax=Pseudomonas abieticivorans TaxID=2931382 RepID=UPI0020BFB4F5|nr:TIGR02444 family protein [Pseudomonas sp. PIA16]